MKTIFEFVQPTAFGLMVAAIMAALTKITIAWLALREDGVEAEKRKDILAELSRMFSWRKK